MSLLKIAHVPPAAVEPGSSVLDAIRLMAQQGVGAVAVAEGGRLRGIFTERDVMLRVAQQERSPGQTRISDVMSAPVETISEETSADEALTFMLERHIRHLPILGKEGEILGMLSIRNLLENQVETLQRELHALDQYLSNDGPGG